MHILVSNDDGPPSDHSSPYVLCWVRALQKAGHTVSVCLPSSQRSWIGKAHLYGQTLIPTYYTPPTEVFGYVEGTISRLPSHQGRDNEWILLDGTPASTVQVGLHHYFAHRGPIDLVLSGPNYGRNSTTCFALSSGTLGAALEAATCGIRSVAVSFAFFDPKTTHDPELITEACQHGVRVIEALVRDWPTDGSVDLYTVNVPLQQGVSGKKVMFTEMLQNYWGKGMCTYKAVDAASDNNGVDPDLEEEKLRAVGEAGADAPSQAEEDKADDANGGYGPVKAKKMIAHKHFRWAPNLSGVYKSVAESAPGNDGWTVAAGLTSVTPLKANFWHAAQHLQGKELELHVRPAKDADAAPRAPSDVVIRGPDPSTAPSTSHQSAQNPQPVYAVVAYEDEYVQPLILSALSSLFPPGVVQLLPAPQASNLSSSPSLASILPDPSAKIIQIGAYEALDFDYATSHPHTSLVNSYVIRKALIRKHFLSATVDHWVAKTPTSILRAHVLRSEAFEVDYAEFLDDALIEAFDLRESMARNEDRPADARNWWILKPGMSDRGQGIRLFSTMEELQGIFDEWEAERPDSDEEEEDDEEEDGDRDQEEKSEVGNGNHIMASHLRHFVAQPYIHPPLLLPDGSGRKFHLRVYVSCIGRLRVYVYKRILALAAAQAYVPPSSSSTTDLGAHLTNTCIQGSELFTPTTVQEFSDLALAESVKDDIFRQICSVTGEVFEAAARAMAVHFQPLSNAFEVFGLDFLVDEGRNAWLLEVNAFPDFRQTGGELKGLVKGFWEETLRLAVGPFVGVEGEGVREGASDMVLARTVDLGKVL